jgi:hypothetical protein
MRKITCLLAVGCVFVSCAGLTRAATASPATTPHAAAPLFPECPPVGTDTGCQFLLTVTDLTVSMATDTAQQSYASNTAATHESGPPTDALVGVRNDSSRPVTQLNVSGSITFEFDGDGICDNASGAVPAGCQSPSGSTACGAFDGPCSFPPPPGEPPNYREPRAPVGTPAFANGDVQNGYEGPGTWFSNVAPSPSSSGTVNFSPALAPGASTYFSLEAPPKGFPVTTTVSATQSAGGMAGARLFVPFGLKILAAGSVQGGTGHATGGVTFQFFRTSACGGAPAASSTAPLGAGGAAAVQIRLRRSGTYYWRVRYSGDSANGAAETTCGGATTVVPPGGTAGLPSGHRCVSSVRATLHVGRRRARSALVFANGRLVQRSGGVIRVRIRGRTSISVIAGAKSHAFTTARSALIQQSRTYHACRR